RYCDKVLLINNGVDEVFDTPKNILKNEGHQSINDFYLSQVGV
ncbi:ABC transporter ATP-binding protein, partial [Bacillus cereus]